MAGSHRAALVAGSIAALTIVALAGCGGPRGAPPKYSSQWNGSGDAAGLLNRAEGLAVDEKGRLLVADTWNDRIVRYSAEGKPLLTFGVHGHKDGELECPRSVSTDSKGNIYVADCWNHRILRFAADGTPRPFRKKKGTILGGKGGPWGYDEADGLFLYPYGVAVDSNGNIYVSDYNNNRLQKFDARGEFLLKWGVEGRQDGQFNHPGALVMDRQDRLWVADVGNNRVQRFRFDVEGKPVFDGQWGKEGDEPGEFDRPYGLAVDKDYNFYVADFGNHRVQKFDARGRLQYVYGELGSGDGELDSPIALAVDDRGTLYVSDWGNNRIQTFLPVS